VLDIPPHVKGLVFDCDGTIADTMPLHYQAWVQALREHQAELPEAMFYEMAGIPTRRIVEILNEKHHYHLDVDAATERKESHFVEMIPKVAPIEPVVELVKQYHGQLPMAVATGGTRSICVKTLQALGLDGYFRAIVTADDVAHGKPAPDIFLEAARRLGVDVWREVGRQVPLTLVGMGSAEIGGAGEVKQQELPGVLAQHRFFFNPIRFTSLGLAVVEAMMAGVPIVGLATTELVTVIDSGRNGYVDTRIDRLVEAMRMLLRDHALAAEWGAAGQRDARERFAIERFVDDWLDAFASVAG
jgi:beta-phosphoglucomutase-like phosphatase (HAD superfamily)